MLTTKHREGFWSSSTEPNLPMPQAREMPFVGKANVLEQLTAVEALAEEVQYRGMSGCRCCKKMNGSREYELSSFGETWTWPSGFRHYIEEHNVVPTQAFLNFLSRASRDIQ